MDLLTVKDIEEGLSLIKNEIKTGHKILKTTFEKEFDIFLLIPEENFTGNSIKTDNKDFRYDYKSENNPSGLMVQETISTGYELNYTAYKNQELVSAKDIDFLGTKLKSISELGIALKKNIFFGIIESILSSPSENKFREDSKNADIDKISHKKIEKEVFNAKEAASFLGFEYRIMGVMRRDDSGPPYSCVRRKYLYTKADLIAWLNSNKKHPQKDPHKCL